VTQRPVFCRSVSDAKTRFLPQCRRRKKSFKIDGHLLDSASLATMISPLKSILLSTTSMVRSPTSCCQCYEKFFLLSTLLITSENFPELMGVLQQIKKKYSCKF
jgi:hypothetical protein